MQLSHFDYLRRAVEALVVGSSLALQVPMEPERGGVMVGLRFEGTPLFRLKENQRRPQVWGRM